MKQRFSYSYLIGLCMVGVTYAFLYVPLIVLAVFSFNAAQFPAPWTGVTVRWYQELWQSTHLWVAFSNSLIVALSATSLSVVMALLLVFYGMHDERVGRLVALFYGNLVIPEVVLAVGLLSMFTFFSVPLGLSTLVVAHTVLGLGYVVPLVYTRYQSLNRALIESSLDLGASMTQTFIKIVVPLLAPTLFTGGLLVFIISFDDFVLSYFCAGSSAQTLSLYILAMLRSGISPLINAASVLLLAASSLLVAIFCWYTIRSRML